MNYYIHRNKYGLTRRDIIVNAEPASLNEFAETLGGKYIFKASKKYYTDADIKVSKGKGYFFEDTRGDHEIAGWLPKTIFEKEFSKLVIVPFDNEP